MLLLLLLLQVAGLLLSLPVRCAVSLLFSRVLLAPSTSDTRSTDLLSPPTQTAVLPQPSLRRWWPFSLTANNKRQQPDLSSAGTAVSGAAAGPGPVAGAGGGGVEDPFSFSPSPGLSSTSDNFNMDGNAAAPELPVASSSGGGRRDSLLGVTVNTEAVVMGGATPSTTADSQQQPGASGASKAPWYRALLQGGFIGKRREASAATEGGVVEAGWPISLTSTMALPMLLLPGEREAQPLASLKGAALEAFVQASAQQVGEGEHDRQAEGSSSRWY